MRPLVEGGWEEAVSGLSGLFARRGGLLSRHTTFRVGGPARVLAEPQNEAALRALLALSRERSVPCVILGGGSNVLAPDDGVPGLVILVGRALGGVLEAAGGRLVFGAGERTAGAVRESVARGLSGLHALSGIPGTIGGACVMNAGTHEGCLADLLEWVEGFDAGGRWARIARAELSPRHRCMALPTGFTVTRVAVLLSEARREDLRASIRGAMLRRRATQPLGLPSAGCVFRNPPAGPPAGALLDGAGMKGLREGGAMYSEMHANWIVNVGGTTARDVLSLIERGERRVLERFGVRLEREIRVL